MLKQLLIVGVAAVAIAGTTSAQTGMGNQTGPQDGGPSTTSGSSNATTGGMASTGAGGGTAGTDRTSTSSTDPMTSQGVGTSPRSGSTDYGTTGTSTAMSTAQGPDGLTWQNGKWMKGSTPATKAQINAHKKWMADNGISNPQR